MKNITISLDEETHRLARVRAEELNTSLSDLVREYLINLVSAQSEEYACAAPGAETRRERRVRLLREVTDEIAANGGGLRMVDNLTRDEIYD